MTATILIVDDSEVVLSVSTAILEEAGYRVLTQSRANGSLSLIIWERPVLVLLDVNMPHMSGDTLARMCTKTAQTTGTCVVLHSTMSEDSLERLVKESGANGYIRKTDSSYTLLRQVRGFLGESGRFRAAESSGRMKAASRSSSSSNRMAAVSDRSSSSSSRMAAVPDRSFSAQSSSSTTSSTAKKPMTESSRGVLLVDRDMTTLSTMREVVRGLGHRSDFALSTKQASDKLRSNNPPEVVVVSADMPESGLSELLESALSLDANWGQRFVVTTAGDPSSCQPRGFTGRVLRKPIEAEDLSAAILRVFPN